jgi:hypothetical protein
MLFQKKSKNKKGNPFLFSCLDKEKFVLILYFKIYRAKLKKIGETL